MCRHPSVLILSTSIALMPWVAPLESWGQAAKGLSNAEIARLGRAATALVVVGANGKEGTAFCIRADGLFVTNHHVIDHLEDFPIKGADGMPRLNTEGIVKLVLNGGRDDQKVVSARVLWSDREWDLALLKAEGVAKLPALAIADEADLAGLRDVVALGFPLGSALAAKGEKYPAVNINKGTIRGIPEEDGKPTRIDANLAINPGNSGGPLLDNKGRVVGVIYARIEQRGTPGFSLAVPVNRLEWFLSRPAIAFEPPPIPRAAREKPVEFRATLTSTFPPKEPPTLELVLGPWGGGERRFPMKLVDGSYRTKAALFAGEKRPPGVKLLVSFDDEPTRKPGLLVAWVEDRALNGVGSPKGVEVDFRLREAQEIRLLKVNRIATLAQRTQVDGVAGLDRVLEAIKDQEPHLDPATIARLFVDGTTDEDTVICSLVARRAGRIVSRLSIPIIPEDSETPSLKAVAAGRFIRPHQSSTPLNSLRLHIPAGDPALKVDPSQGDNDRSQGVPPSSPVPGDPPGSGRIYSYPLLSNNAQIPPRVQDLRKDDSSVIGPAASRAGFFLRDLGPASTTIRLVGPGSGRIKAGETVIQANEPFDLNSPKPYLLLTTHGMPASKDGSYSGRFMVWEIEEEEVGVHRRLELKRLAVDFVLYRKGDKPGEAEKPSISGMLRINSKYQ